MDLSIAVPTWRTRWAATAWWAAVAVVGSAASLSLIDAGKVLHYQHYLDWPVLIGRGLFGVAVLAVQAVLVIGAWSRHQRLARLRRWIGTVAPPWKVGLGFVALVLLSATLNRDLTAYGRELVTATVIQVLQAATIALAVAAWPSPVGQAADAHIASTDGPALERFDYLVAAAVVLVCIGLNWFVYERHPHIPDEVQYLFQARYLAHGRIAIDVPPVPRAFATYLTEWGPRGWYSVVPPGWPLVLAIGVFFGIGSLVNPLLAGINVLLAVLVLHRLYGRRVRRVGVVLLAVSPWNLFLGMSYMPQTVTLTLALLATVGVEKARRTDSSGWAWLAGAALGYLALVRQLDAMIAAVALGLWAIGLGARRLKAASIVGLVGGALLVGATILPYNRYFTGRPTKFPIMAYTDSLYGPGSNDYGFGKNRGVGWALDPRPGHDPIDGMINTNLNATATEVELFGWSFGSLAFVLLHLLVGRVSREDRTMIGAIVLVTGAYFLNYFAGGPDFAARYWFLILVPLIALTVRGIGTLADLPDLDGRRIGVRAIASVGIATLVALVTFVPWRAIDKYWHFRGMRADIRRLAREDGFGPSLVLINGRENPDYASAATYNDLDWNAPKPLYAWNRDSTVAGALRVAFPARPVWVVDGPSRTGGGYRVVAGPIAPGAPIPPNIAAR